MSFLQRTGRRFAAFAVMVACFAASSAFAAMLATNDFETSFSDFTTDSAEALSDLVSLPEYSDNKPSGYTTEPYPFVGEDFGSRYLSVDADTNMVWRTFASRTSSVYFDSYVQFTAMQGDFEYPADSKFVIYLDSATSNLCVICATSDSDTTPVTNWLTSATVIPNSWGRLTVNVLSGSVFSFQVRLNGALLATSGNVKTFYSLMTGATVSQVGFSGTGALDDMVVRTTDPFGTAVATIDGEGYATLQQAVAEAVAGDTIILQANNAEDVNLTEGQTFKLKAGGFTYSGTVYSYSGYRLKTSEPDENGVITYSQAVPYKPSISINFANAAGNGLTTSDDVGLSDYEVPGTSWNNFEVANNTTYSTVNAVDSSGSASVASGVSVMVSGTRGHWNCSSLAPASNPLHGYIDESSDETTPTVTVSGIPYYRYHVIVYHSTDTENATFGYDTINGTNYTYVNDVLTEGTTAWGDSGAQNSANSIAEGGNVLVTGELSGPTLTVVGHRAGGADNARGCIAAIQIIEVKPEIGASDLEIPVSGATTYTVDAAKDLSGTVYLTGNGTLTLDGSAKITASTIYVCPSVTLNVNAARLDGTTFTGAGTVVYDGIVPVTGKGWTESAWTGTVWLKNKSGITGNNNATTGVQPNSLGNAYSKVKFSGVNGWIEAPVTYNPEIVLENDSYSYALQLTNGNSPNSGNPDRATTVKKLSGSGILCCGGTSTAVPTLKVYDATGFTGSINTANADDASYTGLTVVFCEENTTLPNSLVEMFINSSLKRTIYVASGKTVTLASSATWTAETGFAVEGTLNVSGTLVSSHATKAVRGSGTVVFNGKAPSPTGDAWWKNADWTGTVEIKDYATSLGNFHLATYGNSESKVCMNGANGYLYSEGSSGSHGVKELIIGAGGFTQNGSYSVANEFVVPCKVTGSGTYTFSAAGTGQKTLCFTGDMSEFAGLISIGGANNRVVVGTSTDRAFTSNTLIVGNDGVLNVASGKTWNPGGGMFIENGGLVINNGFIWTTGGIAVDGELRATGLDKFGGGTSITTSDTGVFTLIDSDNTQDQTVDYARITGTGTLRYADVSGKWRTLSAVNFPTGMICENNLSEGLILTAQGENTIGSLAGSGSMRSDWGGSQNVADRTLKILQAKDTEYSGVFHTDDRISTVTVAPGASSAGTLTLSGTQTVSNDLVVESGAEVNITGTWIGNVTVAGTIGGTNKITGDLTLSAGATLKVSDTADSLSVSGLTVSGTVAVELPAGAAAGDTFITTSGMPTLSSGATFNVYVGGTLDSSLRVIATANGLQIAPKAKGAKFLFH